MQSIKYLLIVIGLVTPVTAQNLITNPGFENGMTGWNDLWTRTPNTGIFEVVPDPVNSGSNALHILHWGEEDWSFKQTTDFPVVPGEIYEFSAWVNVVQPDNWNELSVALFNQYGEMTNWSFAQSGFEFTNGEFAEFKTRFVIPNDAASLWARFIGEDSSEVFIDDVKLELVDSLGGESTYTLGNSNLSAEISVPSFAMHVKNKSNGKSYQFSPSSIFNILNVDSTSNFLSFHCNMISVNSEVTIKISAIDNHLKFEITFDNDFTLDEPFGFPGYIKSNSGEYFVIPRAAGMLLPVEEEYPFWSLSLFAWKTTMAFTGVTDLNTGYMIATENPWDSEISFIKPPGNNLYTFQFSHHPSKNKIGYSRTFYFVMIDNDGYNEMAQWYREFAENLVP